ncbi:MAG: hypothetical protein ABI678_16180, partial [Kofleriaceae bacterium]
MAVLKSLPFAASLAGAALAACYSPAAPDCTLACSADSDCVADQTCSTDRMCASPTIGTCAQHQATDGGVGSGSGSGSGSASTVDIKVHLDGQGSLQSSNSDTCDSLVPLICTFKAPKGESLTVTAIPHIRKQF